MNALGSVRPRHVASVEVLRHRPEVWELGVLGEPHCPATPGSHTIIPFYPN